MEQIKVEHRVSDAEILNRVNDWIIQFVEEPNPLLNGFAPCPYAKRVRLSNELLLSVADVETFSAQLSEACSAVMSGAKRVALLVFADTARWKPEKCALLVDELREAWGSRDLYFMWDHPQVREQVGLLRMNQGEFFLLFVQRLSELRVATQELEQKGYYSAWPSEAKAELMGSRWVQESTSTILEPDHDRESL